APAASWSYTLSLHDALPILRPGKEREKFLDDVIDRVLKSEKEAKPPAPPDKHDAQEMQIDRGRLADAIPPEDRARMDQFMQDLRSEEHTSELQSPYDLVCRL